MPIELRQSGFIGTISYRNGEVKVNGKNFTDMFSGNNRQSYSVDDATDAAYMQAVIDGDTETAQMMVEGAAAAAGLKGPYYHGTPHGGFTVFDGSRNGK